jgi:hypothetical protein
MKILKRFFGPLALALDLTLMLTGCVADVVVNLDDDWGSNRFEVTAAFSHSVPVGSQVGLRVVAVNGSIEVRGQPGSDRVNIVAVRRVRSGTRYDAEEHLPLLQVSVKVNSNDVLVETVQPKNSNGRDYQVDYVVTVPEEFWADLISANGAILLEQLKANAWAQTANGTVSLRNHTGSSWVSLGNGEIDATIHLPVDGQVVHAVGNGGVALTVQPEVSATFGAQVGNGSITLSGLTLSQSVSGNNSLHGVLGTGSGVIDLSVGNGWIQARGR